MRTHPPREFVSIAFLLGVMSCSGSALSNEWSGPYVGATVGLSLDGGGSESGSLIYPPPANPGFSGAWSGDTNFTGPLGGVLVGYSKTFSGGLLVGLEADIQGADISSHQKLIGTSTSPPQGAPHTPEVDGEQTVKVFGTLRGRLGFVPEGAPDALLYVTGGLAWGRVSNHVIVDDRFTGLATITRGEASDTDLSVGWAGGGGVELQPAFLAGWTVKAEYLFVDLGGSSLSLLGNTHIGLVTNNWAGSDTTNVQFQVVRFGLVHPF